MATGGKEGEKGPTCDDGSPTDPRDCVHYAQKQQGHRTEKVFACPWHCQQLCKFTISGFSFDHYQENGVVLSQMEEVNVVASSHINAQI
jgi:hypothetical protein